MHFTCLEIIVMWQIFLVQQFFCTLRYIARQRVYVIYDAVIYSKRPLLRLRPLPSNNELRAAKAHLNVEQATEIHANKHLLVLNILLIKYSMYDIKCSVTYCVNLNICVYCLSRRPDTSEYLLLGTIEYLILEAAQTT